MVMALEKEREKETSFGYGSQHTHYIIATGGPLKTFKTTYSLGTAAKTRFANGLVSGPVLGFEKPEFDDGAWGGMPVPGNWELNGRLGLLGLDNGMANGIIKRRCCAEQTYADLAVKSPPLRHCWGMVSQSTQTSLGQLYTIVFVEESMCDFPLYHGGFSALISR